MNFCDYCDKVVLGPVRETVCIGPIWTKHGRQPMACEECFDYLYQRDLKFIAFKRKMRIGWQIVIGLIIFGVVYRFWG